MSLIASFALSFSPRDVLDEIWDLIVSVSEGFPTYSFLKLLHMLSFGMLLYCKYKLAADNLYVLFCRKKIKIIVHF